MASCNLGGGLNLKVLSSYPNFNKARCSGKEVERNQWRSNVFHGATLVHLRKACSTKFTKQHLDPNPFVASCSSSQIKGQPEDVFVERKTNSARSQMISSSEVQSLLTNICDTTTIAEFKLNLGGFRIYVKRNLDGDGLENLPPTLPPIYVDTPIHFPNSNGSATSTSLAITKSANSTEEIQSFSDAHSDEGFVMLPSPKVGFFRRSRTIKGKRAPPSCKEKQEVKEGQVICYIEQLGGEIPIESDVSGEVVKILKKDGEPVGYGDALIAILPSFPGIKKLQLSA